MRRAGRTRIRSRRASACRRRAAASRTGGARAAAVRAVEDGVEHAPRWETAHTIASGIRVPQAVGDFLILRAVRESGGFAIAVSDGAATAAAGGARRGGRWRAGAG